MESNIGARGLPKIVGERPDAATIEAKIVPSPKPYSQVFLYRSLIQMRLKPGRIAISVWGVVTSSFVAKNKTFGRLKYVAALTIFK